MPGCACIDTQVRLKDDLEEVRMWTTSLFLESVLFLLCVETFLGLPVPLLLGIVDRSSTGNT